MGRPAVPKKTCSNRIKVSWRKKQYGVIPALFWTQKVCKMSTIEFAHLSRKLWRYPECDGNVRTIIDESAHEPVRGKPKLRFSIHATDMKYKRHVAATTRDEVRKHGCSKETKKVAVSFFNLCCQSTIIYAKFIWFHSGAMALYSPLYTLYLGRTVRSPCMANEDFFGPLP